MGKFMCSKAGCHKDCFEKCYHANLHEFDEFCDDNFLGTWCLAIDEDVKCVEIEED